MADSSILEQQRRCHEERERLQDAMVREMVMARKTGRDQINSDFYLRTLLDHSSDCMALLHELYEDKDGLRRAEIAALSGPNEFVEFYGRLKSIKDFHRKHPNELCIPMSTEFEEMTKQRENPSEEMQNLVDFTDEEGYGKYLDLHESYNLYINLKGIDKVDYVTYLNIFDQFYDIPKDRKNSNYKEYMDVLLKYLAYYCSRVKPLLDLNEELTKVMKDFERKWDEGTFMGWPKAATGALTHSGVYLDLSSFSSWEELASLGLDRLKLGLMYLGIKCGGTLEERAQRLFRTKGKTIDELDPSLLAKSKPGKAGKERDTERHMAIAGLEAQLYFLTQLLTEQRVATRENVQRKQAQTGEERDEEDLEHMSDDDSDDDGSSIPYNPKNLPLGWDGKPIPYWLYKLHGLNLSYACEICGNYTYRGPKVFQRHFAEWRHAHGMRCLGVPNTAHFANVTLIEDAIALWQKLKLTKEFERWKPETEEEFEDSTGNVVAKKTFEDLRRQGLL